MKKVAVVIPAGGAGRRMGRTRKPFLELDGVPLLERSLEPFLARRDVRWVVVAVPVDIASAPPAWLIRDDRVVVVAGGAERTDSVRNGLRAVPDEADVVVVHDAARPLVSGEIIERCIDAAVRGGSVIAAVPVVDTLKEVAEDGRIVSTPDRRRMWAAQTPQAFPAAVLRDAHARAEAEGTGATDDAALVARYGGIVNVVEGAPENLKITTAADLVLASALLAARR